MKVRQTQLDRVLVFFVLYLNKKQILYLVVFDLLLFTTDIRYTMGMVYLKILVWLFG